MRPVDLPEELHGKPSPCNLFNARGVLLIKAGAPIPALAHDPLWPVRLYCAAEDAHRVSHRDPQAELQGVGTRLSILSARLVLGEHLTSGELGALAQTVFDLWRLDGDACLGLARLAPHGQPSAWHAIHVALISAELAQAAGLEADAIRSVIGGALSMNLSTLVLHDEMYNLPGAPSAAARAALRRHPSEGVQYLLRIGKFQLPWIEAVGAHHENIDGSGYPEGLRGHRIPLAARIVRVADTLAARLTGRKLRPPQHWNLRHARDLRHLVLHVFGPDVGRLDPSLTHRLLQVLSRFPPGSLVRLSTGELAVVARRHAAHAVPRQVLAVFDGGGKPYPKPQPRQLHQTECAIRGYAHDTLRSLPAYDWQRAWGYGTA